MVVLTAALLGWVGFKLLPDDQSAVRKLMLRLVQAASVKPNESNLARLTYADRLADFFTTNATLQLEGLHGDFPAINSRSDLLAAAMAARSQLRQADFALADLNVTFPDKRSANAYVVITGTINFQTNQFGQAFRIALKKAQGHWLINEMHTVEQVR